ncbi:DNA polymerase III subunit gamma/tau [Patescibacteria group bacterium]
MFYTRYRPQKFSEMAQPNEVAKALSTQIKKGKTAHAYLLVGPRGIGKTTIARILAKALNCKSVSEKGDPCGKCVSCKGIKEGSFLDLIEIDAASNRGIDDIRDLRERIKLAPAGGKQKVYIVDEVHMLTTEAFNALLKTLEEPPAHATFILCTTEFHKIPATIKSRCQVFKLKRATIEQLVKRLDKMAKEEGQELGKEGLRHIARAASGSFRDGETILQQVIEGGLDVETLTNLGTRLNYVEFLEYIVRKDVREALHVVEKLDNEGVDLYTWIGGFLSILRELLFAQSGAIEEPRSLDSVLKETNSAQTVRITDTIMKAHSETKNSFITQLPLELAIVELCGSEYSSVEPEKIAPSPKAPKKIATSPAKRSPLPAQAGRNDKTEERKKPGKNVKMSVDEVKEKWILVLNRASEVNNSIMALLKSSALVQVIEGSLEIEVPFDFHKERIESIKNRKIIEEIFSDVLGVPLGVSCLVKKKARKSLSNKETGKLTDMNIVIPEGVSKQESPEELVEVLDGGLPMI